MTTPAEKAVAEAKAKFKALLSEIPPAVDTGTKNALSAMDAYKQKLEECINSPHPQEAQLRKELEKRINIPVDPEIQHKANQNIDSLLALSRMHKETAELIKNNPQIESTLRKEFAQTDMQIPVHVKERLSEDVSQGDLALRAQLCGQMYAPKGNTR